MDVTLKGKAAPFSPPRGFFPRFDWRARRVWERDLVAWLKIYKTSLLLNFGEPFMNLVALGFGLGTYVASLENVSFAAYIAPGLLASTAMLGVSYDMAFTGFAKLHRDGVYDSILTGPVEVESIVCGEILWEISRSILYGSTFLTVIFLLGLIQSPLALLVPPLMVLPGIIFAAPALVVATLARVEDQLFYYFTLAITPMFMFSGIFFPVENLPPLARNLIWFTPLYHVVRLSRGLVLGRITPDLWTSLFWLLVVAVLQLPVPVYFMKRKLLS